VHFSTCVTDFDALAQLSVLLAYIPTVTINNMLRTATQFLGPDCY